MGRFPTTPARGRFAMIVAQSLVVGGLVPLATAQSTPDAAEDSLHERLDALERRNDALEARLNELLQSEPDDAGDAEEESTAAEANTWFAQLFGDYGAGWQSRPEDGAGRSAFQLGSLDIFLTGQLGDRLGVLAEVILEGGDDELAFDAERLWTAWNFSDGLYLKLGLEHLPISRWNRVWHHGKYLELTIERPFLARFEDDGGPLPMHVSGLEAGGRQLSGAGQIEWTAMLSNGRGPVPEDRQRTGDDNGAKALDLSISLAPSAFDGLRFGAAARRDAFPADPGSGRLRAEEELAASAFVQFDHGPWNLLAEAATLLHDDRGGGSFHHRGAYAQVGFRDGEWTPYARLDLLSMERGDPFYVDADLDLDRIEALVGVRRELGERAALKLELRRSSIQERAAGAATSRRSVTTLAFQFSWYL